MTAQPEAGQVVWLRVHPELRRFVTARYRRDLGARRDVVPLRHDGTATVGHLIESVGIPLPEIGPVRAGEHTVPPCWQPREPVTVEVSPVGRPQRVEPRFLLDVHLGTLARRLRLLGVDASYSNDADDGDLIEQARAQRRFLLTQDRALLCRRALWRGGYVRGSRPSEQTADVVDRFAPPLRPWTRCTSCNGMLFAVSKQDVLTELEPGTRRCYDTYARCDWCGRVYWRGAHSRRINAIIEAARAAHPDR